MKIESAYIYGFGKWVDFTIDFSHEGLQFVYGENESGKSTLHHFLLFMLFGLPPKERALFRPKKSSKFGGQLVIYDEVFGECIIERLEHQKKAQAVCKTADGKTHDESWLKEQLHGMTTAVYQSIYGFSAMDLAGIEDLKEEDLGEILLGIGFTGASKLHQVEKRLTNQLGELFKPSGKNPKINQELETLQRMQQEIAVYRNEEAVYLEKKQRLKQLEKQEKELQLERSDAQERRLHLEKIQQALSALESYQAAAVKLQQLPEHIPFPTHGLERIAALKDKLIPLKSELSIVKANETETLTELEEIDKSIQAFPKDPVQELLQSHAQYQHVCREIQQINESIHTEKTKLETELAHLGIGFSMEDIKDVQFPFHLEKTWEEIKNLSEKIALEKATATSERRKLNEQQTYLEEHIQQLQREMLTEDKRLALERTKQAYERKDMAKALLETGTKNKQAWLMQQRKQDRQAKIYAYSGFIAAIIFAIAAWWTKHFGYLAGMLASAFFGLSQWHWQKKKNKTVAEMFNDFGPSEANENTTEADYQSSKERLKQDDLTRQEADKLFEKMKDLDLQLLRVEAKMQEIKQQEEQLAANKQKQIGNYPFLQQVEIASWPRLFHLCTNLLRIRDEIIARETRKNKLETQNERFINKLHMFAQKNVGQYNSDTNAPSPDRLMEQINKQYQQYQTNKQRFADLKQSLEKTTTRKQELQEAIAVYNTELQQLYQTAEVEDEEAFYKMAEMKKLQQSLREQLQQIRVQFSIYFSDKEWQQLVNEQPKQSKLEWQSKQVDEKIEQLESSISENQKERAAIVTELAQMEHAKTHSELTHRFQMEQDKLAALAEKWAVLKLAKEMLEETKRDFRDKYITEVMRQTSAYFRELTGNKYHKVFAPADKQTFSVESADKITFAVNELSKGTVDQLYVSLRLAISKVISDENNMPFIIDDGFVHFDTRRNTRMMHLLQEISANRQIILFSCRKELAENVGVNNIIRLSNPVRIS